MTIDLTKEIQQRVAAYRLALVYMTQAVTETAAIAWRDAAHRHRSEVGRLVDLAIGDRLDVAVTVADILGHGIELAVAVPGEETTCAE